MTSHFPYYKQNRRDKYFSFSFRLFFFPLYFVIDFKLVGQMLDNMKLKDAAFAEKVNLHAISGYQRAQISKLLVFH